MARRGKKENEERRNRKKSREEKQREREEAAKQKKKDGGMTYENPHAEGELENQKFKYPTNSENSFRGQPLPGHFEVHASETQRLIEGQVIGTTRFGQTLYWIHGSVVAKG